MLTEAPVDGCYLVHLDQPLGHAKHRVGWSDNIDRRIEEHRRGDRLCAIAGEHVRHECHQGSPLLCAANHRGITWRLARTWPGADRTFEKKLRQRRGDRSAICPCCQQQPRLL